MSNDEINALVAVAMGVYADVFESFESYLPHSIEKIIGKRCIWCAYNTHQQKNPKHCSTCPTTEARRSLSAAKIIMMSWKITYIVPEDVKYTNGTHAEIRIDYVSYSTDINFAQARSLVERKLSRNGRMPGSIRVVQVDFYENLGYVIDDNV